MDVIYPGGGHKKNMTNEVFKGIYTCRDDSSFISSNNLFFKVEAAIINRQSSSADDFNRDTDRCTCNSI